MVLTITPSFASAEPNSFAICTASNSQKAPSIDGDIVVWQDYRSGGWDIYGYNLATKTNFPICTIYGKQDIPAISRKTVVCRDYCNSKYSIYVFKLSSQIAFRISGIKLISYLAVFNNIVIYKGGVGGNIYGYNLATKTKFSISDREVQSPAISGNTIVWVDNRNGERDIYGCKFTRKTSTEFNVCTYRSVQSSPAISRNTIVWEDNRNENWDIYGRNLGSRRVFPICTNNSDQLHPAISGNIIVWEDRRNGNSDIYGYNLSRKTEFPICTHKAKQSNPTISGNTVVWEDNRNGEWDIYGAILELPASPAP